MKQTSHKPESHKPVQTCGSCKKRWTDWKHFLLDADVRLLGLQVSPNLAEANLLVFEHRCGSSISVLASRLRHLLPAPPEESNTQRYYGTEVCREHCSRLEDLEACDQLCVNATDRRLVQLLLSMKRGALSTPEPGHSALAR